MSLVSRTIAQLSSIVARRSVFTWAAIRMPVRCSPVFAMGGKRTFVLTATTFFLLPFWFFGWEKGRFGETLNVRCLHLLWKVERSTGDADCRCVAISRLRGLA